MDRNQRWLTLIPGYATDYFTLQDFPMPAPELHSRYSPANALLFAELCRWVYNTDQEDQRTQQTQAPHPNPYLDKANLREVQLIVVDSAQASLVCNDDQSCYILVFRGTDKIQDWMANLNASATRWWGQGMVHQGFMEAFSSIWEQLVPILKPINVPLFYAGHSLGAAMATLAASLQPPTALYTYGSPRVGDTTFAEYMKDIPTYRIVNGQDIVPTLPIAGKPLHYEHIGELHRFGKSLKWNLYRILSSLRFLFRQRTFATKTFPKIENPLHPPPFLLDHAPYFYVLRLLQDYQESLKMTNDE